jgi:hypothetical protein
MIRLKHRLDALRALGWKPRQNAKLVVCPEQQRADNVLDNVGCEVRGNCSFDAEPA